MSSALTEDLIFTVDVGFTRVRPVIPDQFVRQVTVAAPSRTEADLIAHDMIFGRKGVVMVTSIRFVRVSV